MKFPSIKKIVSSLESVLMRFPFAIAASIFGTDVAYLLVDLPYDGDRLTQYTLTRLVWVSLLALPFFLSSTLFAESNRFSKPKTLVVSCAVLLLLMGIYFSFNSALLTSDSIRFVLLFISFHLLVSFAGFLSNSSINAFWEFNKVLFLRILTALLYSTVIYIGLCIAILTVDQLFALDLNHKVYGKLFCIIFGLFNTTFFLAGVPSTWNEVDPLESYPKGLKVFTQFVLIPLSIIYLLILLAYEAKIVLQWSLPDGWVGWLVAGYAVFGIFSFLLIFPIRTQEENRWIHIFSRWFYLLLVPLIALLFVAIWTRIHAYGITENRYLLVALGVWLTGITIYFLLQKTNIRIIPISLFLLCLMATWGPQSAPAMSMHSQLSRITSFYESKNSYHDGKLKKLPDSVKTPKEIYNLPYYLLDRYHPRAFQNTFGINIDSLFEAVSKEKKYYQVESEVISKVRAHIGMNSIAEDYDRYFSIESKFDSVSISNYKTLIPIDLNSNDFQKLLATYQSAEWLLEIEKYGITYQFVLDSAYQSIAVKFDGENEIELDQPLYITNTRQRSTLVIFNLTFDKERGSKVIFLNHVKGLILLHKD
ncbi:MAG: DUF4153 domain-containing protein [Cyclobacteriaceae bacterium]|jgi:hypothetical protein|nr:DUF4153 domain-containing protein [Flammeovirgaceae bacterium]